MTSDGAIEMRRLWKAIEGNRFRWLTETLTGLLWPVYALFGYPLGEVPDPAATMLWWLAGVVLVRTAGCVAFLVLVRKIEEAR